MLQIVCVSCEGVKPFSVLTPEHLQRLLLWLPGSTSQFSEMTNSSPPQQVTAPLFLIPFLSSSTQASSLPSSSAWLSTCPKGLSQWESEMKTSVMAGAGSTTYQFLSNYEFSIPDQHICSSFLRSNLETAPDQKRGLVAVTP